MEHFATAAELARSVIELFLAVCAFMSGLWMLWRKVSKAIDKYTVQVDAMADQFKALGDAQKILVEAQCHLTTAVGTLSGKLDGREKDVMRLEGALDATRKDMMQLVAAVQQSVGSLDGLWRTMQTLFPNQVPKRASDKGG